MSKIKEAADRMAQILECVDAVANARKILAEKSMDYKTFGLLNVDGSMETLLGKTVTCFDFETPEECAKMRIDITNALLEVMKTNASDMRAALECFVTDLSDSLQAYDAHADECVKTRAELIEAIGRMDSAAKDKLAETVMEFESFSYHNALEVCEALIEIAGFIDDQCDKEILETIASCNGADMSEDQKEYLVKFSEKVAEGRFAKEDWFDVAMNDRIGGVTLEKLGFDAAKLIEVAKKLTKAEGIFIKAVRSLKEVIVRDTSTDEEVVVKNVQFWDVMGKFTHLVYDGSKCRNYLSEQLNLAAKQISLISSEVPKSPEEPDAE